MVFNYTEVLSYRLAQLYNYKRHMSDNFQEKPVTNPSVSSDLTIKGIYILAITAEKLEPEALMPVVQMADTMLQNKNTTFTAMMERALAVNAPIEVANIQYAGSLMHTPQTMQSTLAGWIQKQYNVAYQPVIGQTFFPQGTRDPQGRDNFFLFYFDV
ncbi:hypothetical protein [Vacuolonema iberomarrocanum]|uniref:hypothetical protein n=1 Tax=Vacuolonema iberomarrocanum TaxID=3454632 RepID=UPI001A0D58FC|nr:hypothetical protein [filamentous cyanobacterium LEGE 07170]